MTEGLDERLAALADRIGSLGSLVVAFSGGADSAFLLAAAVRRLGSRPVLAATSTSASLAAGEWAEAHAFATALGVEHIAVVTDEMDRSGYRDNGPDRCYHCKSALGDELLSLAAARGLRYVATGTNADDLAEPHRPGLRAAAERRVVTPLADAALTKTDVRHASQLWGLPTWDKPQAACLASRIAYGVPVDADRLARVDRAEQAVRGELLRQGLTVRDVRVRDLGDRASVEIDSRLVGLVDAARLVVAVEQAGFPAAVVDGRGFRSGSLNEVLRADELAPGHLARSSWDLPLVD